MGNGSSESSPLREEGNVRSSGDGRKASIAFSRDAAHRNALLVEEAFHTVLTLERRRAERSCKPFVLMLVDASALLRNGSTGKFPQKITTAVVSSTRETDLIGWYTQSTTLGVIFTEVSLEGNTPITEILQAKIGAALEDNLGRDLRTKIVVSFHIFPENWEGDRSGRMADTKLYPDLSRRASRKKLPLVIKRAMDIVGSGILLLLFSPVFAVVALAIKLTSKGPVIFEQERLGQFGIRFKCLKFRTMHVNNDCKIHQDYIQRFISGAEGAANQTRAEAAVYKITNDPRITPIGRLLRRTSLDELPQFWNVLRGEMSLVGPRPPLPYEFEVYDIWHRRRVLEVKPGVTGLWQVSGRSRTRFDEMVRLDLRYSQSWSLWLDLKILIATPRAVFSGDGAY